MKTLKTNFWLDVLIFAGALAALQPRLTGMAIHEWLALAAGITLILHVVLHWDWIVGISRTFFKNLLHGSRLNYVVDAALFAAFTLAMTSGLLISRVIVPTLGLQLISSRSWAQLHNLSANLSLFLLALHFALHWSWIKNTFHRLLIAPFAPRRVQPQAKRSPLPAPMSQAKAL